MKRRVLKHLTLLAGLVLGTPSAMAAWSYSFSDMGVNYTFADLTVGDALTHSYSLVLDTTGYTGPAGAYLDSVDIKAWDGTSISFALASAPNGTAAWGGTEGPISSGPASNTGCGGSGSGFACVEASTKGIFDVASGAPYAFMFDVTAGNTGAFYATSAGAHIGAGYADFTGAGAGYGITSVTAPVPEPETYMLLIAGLLVLGFMVRRAGRPQLSSAAA